MDEPQALRVLEVVVDGFEMFLLVGFDLLGVLFFLRVLANSFRS